MNVPLGVKFEMVVVAVGATLTPSSPALYVEARGTIPLLSTAIAREAWKAALEKLGWRIGLEIAGT